MEIELKRAKLRDAETLWDMQKRSFAALLEKYGDTATNPAAEPLSKTQTRLNYQSTFYYFICADGARVGAVRVTDRKDGTPKRISPLFVLPEFRKRGYATRAVEEIERIHGASGWELDTILQEEATCRFYENLGYRQTGEEKRINSALTLVFYEK